MAKEFDVRLRTRHGTYAEFAEKNGILLEGEQAVVSMDNGGTALYVGDGVTAFIDLEPLWNSKFVLGKSEVNLQAVQIQPTDWENNTCVKTVAGVINDETKQLLIPVYSQASRQACLSAGLDFTVKNTAELEFTVLHKPTEVLTIFIGIFGVTNDDEDANKPILITPIDANLSTDSENPVQNKVLANKFSTLEAELRAITGGGSTGDNPTSLPAITEKLNNATTYSTTPTEIGTWTDGTSKVMRTVVPFTFSVSKVNAVADIDISAFEITPTLGVTMSTLINGSWSGKASTGEFIGTCPILIRANGKIVLLNVPTGDTVYTLTGNVTVEYVAGA